MVLRAAVFDTLLPFNVFWINATIDAWAPKSTVALLGLRPSVAAVPALAPYNVFYVSWGL